MPTEKSINATFLLFTECIITYFFNTDISAQFMFIRSVCAFSQERKPSMPLLLHNYNLRLTSEIPTPNNKNLKKVETLSPLLSGLQLKSILK